MSWPYVAGLPITAIISMRPGLAVAARFKGTLSYGRMCNIVFLGTASTEWPGWMSKRQRMSARRRIGVVQRYVITACQQSVAIFENSANDPYINVSKAPHRGLNAEMAPFKHMGNHVSNPDIRIKFLH